MELSFVSKQLQRQCESESELGRAHGTACAKRIAARLADLAAARTLAELHQLPGRCHELAGKRAGQLGIEASGGKRLIVEPAHNPIPRHRDGGLDWARVEAVRVLAIVNYHRG